MEEDAVLVTTDVVRELLTVMDEVGKVEGFALKEEVAQKGVSYM